ncbi:hypothetical protein BaRGS_00001750 [Batillaria attramentaria]|uniref:G-protein coupled receptors family 1 profile domain-containing protein n=1 Tax=Batillaria attramentaria TaxID=370345 RepID=A0ABD0M4Q9_9CAEN
MALTLTDYVYVSSECIVGVIVIFSNTLVLLAIVRSASLHKAQYVFFASLASADLLVGILVPPSVILSYWGWPQNFHGCLLLNSTVVLITNISLLSMVAVTFDRYLAICHPVLYTKDMNVRRAFYIVAVAWFIAITLGLAPVMGWNKGEENFKGYCAFIFVICMDYMVYMIFLGINLPLLIFMGCVYAYIFTAIRKLEANRKGKGDSSATRGAKTMLTIVLVFFICWIPLHILNTISLFAQHLSPRFQVLLAFIVLSHANSFMNPFIYSLRNARIRDAFADLFCERFASAIRIEPSSVVVTSVSASPSLQTVSTTNQLNTAGVRIVVTQPAEPSEVAEIRKEDVKNADTLTPAEEEEAATIPSTFVNMIRTSIVAALTEDAGADTGENIRFRKKHSSAADPVKLQIPGTQNPESQTENPESQSEKLESQAAVGESRVAVGKSRVAVGESRVAGGESRVAVGKSRVAGGESRVAVGDSRVAVGESIVTVGESIVAVGESRAAVEESRVAVGESRVAVGESRVAVGES